MKKYYYCVDVGGTSIKAGIIDNDGAVMFADNLKTVPGSINYLAESIIILLEKLEKTSKLKIKNAVGIGIGLPGLADNESGELKFSGNLKLTNYPLKQELEKKITIPIKIANDADVATLTEKQYGMGVNSQNFIMVTIGTGIGGGIVCGGKLLSEFSPFAGEIGHIKTTREGVKCTCGDQRCWEAIASAKALGEMVSKAMIEHPESAMWKTYTPDMATAKTVFDYLAEEDETAKTVFEEYIANLGDGIVSLVNIFAPDMIIIGGAISSQKSKLTAPLEEYVNSHIYARHAGFKVRIVTAKYTENAGIIGGRCLFL